MSVYVFVCLCVGGGHSHVHSSGAFNDFDAEDISHGNYYYLYMVCSWCTVPSAVCHNDSLLVLVGRTSQVSMCKY